MLSIVDVNLVSYWGYNWKTVMRNNKLCIMQLDFTVGKAMQVNETLGNNFPAPKLPNASAQFISLPCFVICADTVTFKYSLVGVDTSGNLVSGDTRNFKDRIIVNASYPI